MPNDDLVIGVLAITVMISSANAPERPMMMNAAYALEHHLIYNAAEGQTPPSAISSVVDLPDVRRQLPIEYLAADGHLQLIKRVLHDIVAVQLVNAPEGDVHVDLCGVCEDEELCAGEGVEALHPEVLRL
jgi:hypothetical protein